MTENLLSYSANQEDVILHRIFGGQETGFYIDVGAAHPVMENDTKALYDRGWTGVNVEPNPSLFTELQRLRPRDRNLNLALSDGKGEFDYFEVVGTGLSTLDPAEADRCAANGHVVIQHRMVTRTLGAILAEQPPEAIPETIDLLKVDVEGYEERVLAGNDWQRFRPRVILVEATFPETPRRRETGIEAMLAGHGYRRAYFDGLNDFYVERKFRGAAGAFDLPPNVFDGFESYRISDLKRHADALEAQIAEAQRYNDANQAAFAPLQERVERLEREKAGLARERLRLTLARDALQADAHRLRGSVATLTAQVRQFGLDLEQTRTGAEEVALLRGELQRVHAHVGHVTGELTRLDQHYQQERAMRQAMHASTSWRLTRPVRLVARAVRAARGRGWR